MNVFQIDAKAREIVRGYGWVADRDVPEGDTPESVFGWYVGEAISRGEVREYDGPAVVAKCVAIWKANK